jgi:hypothetical protein
MITRLLPVFGTAIILISGCATTSSIVPYGKDSYLISAEDAWGGASSGSLQVKAAEKANQFCESQGKKLVVRNLSAAGVQAWTGTSSTLVFSCLDASDPEYSRPTLRKEADTVIEDRRGVR